jgi:RNase P/RNase MRP subunit p29
MIKKRHHYIPKFYLSGFTVPKEPKMIWVYPKDGSEPFKTNIINVGVEKNFYAAQHEDGKMLEDYLAEKIEDPATPIIRKLRGNIKIGANEKRVLATYLVGMLTRVPTNRDRVSEDIPRRVVEAQKNTLKQIENQKTKLPKENKRISKLKSQVIESFKIIERDLIEELSLPYFDENLITIIHIMNWSLFTCCENSTFVTSDNPFCFTEDIGLVNDEGYFIFPLSTGLLLTGGWAPEGIKDFDINYRPLNKETHHAMNKIIISSAKKYVYHHSKNDWITTLIRKL